MLVLKKEDLDTKDKKHRILPQDFSVRMMMLLFFTDLLMTMEKTNYRAIVRRRLLYTITNSGLYALVRM